MPKRAKTITPTEEMVRDLRNAFSWEIVDIHGTLLLATKQVLAPEANRPDEDPIGVESLMNKYYVRDLTGYVFDQDDRENLMPVGRALVKVWAERIALRFPGRRVLFFLGGEEAVILRFHVRREGQHDWTDIEDRRFLRKARLEVYELGLDGELSRLHPTPRRTILSPPASQR
jgi:hypothetical protein